MTYPTWQPGTVYPTGAIVIPSTVQGAQVTVIPNASFDDGDSGYAKDAGWAINTNVAFSGSYSAEFTGVGAGTIVSDTKHDIVPGKAITASVFVHQGAADDGVTSAAVILEWYDSGDSLISTSTGSAITTGAVGEWRRSTVSAVAPPLAAKVAIGATANSDGTAINVDNFAWNYVTGVAATGLAYKNVGDTGTSGPSEPDWPTTVGGQVSDPPLSGDTPPEDPPEDPPDMAPGQASSPNPSSSSSGVDSQANLFWSPGSDATSHDVYFGTTNPPGAGNFQGNQLGASFNPGTLDFDETYYWRIDEVNVVGTTAGPVWSFTVESDPGPPPPPPSTTDLNNPGFEEGDTGWTKGVGWLIRQDANARSGTWVARNYSANVNSEIVQSEHRAVTPGTSITASCYIKVDNPSEHSGRVLIRWYDESNVEISNSYGNVISSNSYSRSTVGGTAPLGAAYAAIGCQSISSVFGNYMYADDFDWSL